MRAPYLDDGDVVLYAGDCVEVMAEMEPESVDAVVCDPPYGLSAEPDMDEVLHHWLDGDDYKHRGGGFMGRTWDSFVPGPAVWREVYRVLKPGGHVLAFSGTRTSDMQTIALRLAGFEIRDTLAYLFGSGFPKSLDVSKAIDRAAGAEREVVRERSYDLRNEGGYSGGLNTTKPRSESCEITAPATPEAAAWAGWGTALKPGHEPIVVARKPLAERTVAAQVLATGTGALNVDGCRIGKVDGDRTEYGRDKTLAHNGSVAMGKFAEVTPYEQHPAGRWPANVCLDESAAALLDAEVVFAGDTGCRSGVFGSGKHDVGGERVYGAGIAKAGRPVFAYGDTGGPSRFFYTAKASSEERDGSSHPTVKPVSLMRWLTRLVCPPGGVILDPFLGSGTTAKACRAEGFRCIGIEREAEYLADAAHRLRQLSLLGEVMGA